MINTNDITMFGVRVLSGVISIQIPLFAPIIQALVCAIDDNQRDADIKKILTELDKIKQNMTVAAGGQATLLNSTPAASPATPNASMEKQISDNPYGNLTIRLLLIRDLIEFIKADGYEDERFWKATNSTTAGRVAWRNNLLSRAHLLDEESALEGANYWEASAIAQWQGCRLPFLHEMRQAIGPAPSITTASSTARYWTASSLARSRYRTVGITPDPHQDFSFAHPLERSGLRAFVVSCVLQ